VEADLLSKAASRLQRLRDEWADTTGNDLNDALLFNRRLWSIFTTSVFKDDSILPDDLKQNIAKLGIFVLKNTLSVQAEPGAHKLDVLININRNLAAGLRGSSAAAE
jgi:flagellar protein FlaF